MALPDPTCAPLPPHLARYVVAQDYAAYTARDQAVWRHILGRLTTHLKDKAHPSYLAGLEAAGIGVERIPSLAEMNGRLARLGWRAVAVRGFLPPAVFTELQAMGILAIAEDIRSHEHIEYTPAPDIVHESAGHAPILADARYADYVRRCGVVGFKAIASREDQAVYEAIRHLSVVKEDPAASGEDAAAAEARLRAACAGRTYVSESTRASRLYWWTAEYGLVGTLEAPRIYGAGLLSSMGEALHCLTPAVEKRPLSLACVEAEYDITTMQPRLFVARDFEQLFELLEAFEATLAWKRGGDFGLEEALRARTVNHLVLADGVELTGVVVRRIPGPGSAPGTTPGTIPGLTALMAQVAAPVLVSRAGKALGDPSPLPALVVFEPGALPASGAFAPNPGAFAPNPGAFAPNPGAFAPNPGAFALAWPDGLSLSGRHLGGQEVVDLVATLNGVVLDLPRQALCFFSASLPSVAGGPADPETWDRWFGPAVGLVEGDAEGLARRRKASALPPRLGELYQEVRWMRDGGAVSIGRLAEIRQELDQYPGDWLLRDEVAELMAPAGTPNPGIPS